MNGDADAMITRKYSTVFVPRLGAGTTELSVSFLFLDFPTVMIARVITIQLVLETTIHISFNYVIKIDLAALREEIYMFSPC